MSILDPVEGVSVEQWAEVNAKLASGTAAEEAIKDYGMDMPKWDRVNNEWTTRMSNDTSFVISQKYAAAFNSTATGNLGSGAGINAESVPFEKFVESMVAQDVLGRQERMASRHHGVRLVVGAKDAGQQAPAALLFSSVASS